MELAVARPWWASGPAKAVAAFSFTVLAVGLFRSRSQKLGEQRQILETSARRFRESQERERKRLASELHDNLGQSLLIIKNRALLASEPGQDSSAVKEQLDAVIKCSSQAIEEVREMAYELSTYHLERVGLTAALEGMIDRVASSSRLEVNKRLEAVDDLYSPEAAISIYRLAQEAFNNVVRHSQASRVEVNLVRDVREVKLVIEDNGRGFPVNGQEAKSVRRGFGLDDMMERAHCLGGYLAIDAETGRGTRLSLTLPLR